MIVHSRGLGAGCKVGNAGGRAAGWGQKVYASHVGPLGDAGGARGAPYGRGGQYLVPSTKTTHCDFRHAPAAIHNPIPAVGVVTLASGCAVGVVALASGSAVGVVALASGCDCGLGCHAAIPFLVVTCDSLVQPSFAHDASAIGFLSKAFSPSACSRAWRRAPRQLSLPLSQPVLQVCHLMVGWHRSASMYPSRRTRLCHIRHMSSWCGRTKRPRRRVPLPTSASTPLSRVLRGARRRRIHREGQVAKPVLRASRRPVPVVGTPALLEESWQEAVWIRPCGAHCTTRCPGHGFYLPSQAVAVCESPRHDLPPGKVTVHCLWESSRLVCSSCLGVGNG